MSDRPLRVAIDARCLNVDQLRGMGKALDELMKRTANSGAVEWHLLSQRADLFHTWEQWALPRRASRLEADVLHSPATSMPWWQPVPTVVTVHGTTPWRHEDPQWPAGFYLDRLLPSAYHRAAAVMTTSDCSRRNILAKWPKLKPKLHVVPLGVDDRYLEAQPDYGPITIAGRVVPEPYLLYFGGSDPRRRLTWALQTWLGSSTDTSLVVCGLESRAHDSIRRMVPHNLQDRLFLAPFIADQDMPRLYLRAAAVLYPSLHEGFGLAVLEAQAVGTPVLLSDVDSLCELKGPGAVALPVDELQAWTRTVANIVKSPERLAGPDQVARAWAHQYSWDAFVDRTLAVYHSVAHRHPVPQPLAMNRVR